MAADVYTLQSNIAQSSIGFQIFYWNATDSKFNYLVPVTSDPPALGSAPSTIETTEADSKVKTYVADRPDQPSVELEYNFDSAGHNYARVKGKISATEAKPYLFLLPLGTGFVVKGTGATWLAGGNPVHGAVSIAQSEEAVMVPDLTSAITDATVVATLNNWLGAGTITSGTTKLKDIIDLTTVPTIRKTDAETNA
jgi:hypothetical protein